MIYIGAGKREGRALHWSKIKTRVRTHEGELLSGKKGIDYQKKWSKSMLGKDLAERGFRVSPQRVEQYEKTKV